ncbi:MAG: hypothetical protein ACK2VA_17205 [Anaerolineae bacterium]
MSVQFDWQVGSNEGQWEILASRGGGPRIHWPWWIWLILALVVSGMAAGGYLLLRRRYAAAVSMAEFQIQNVIDIEARAFAQGDEERYLEQQDIAALDWYRWQQLRIQPDCPSLLTEAQSLSAYCSPALPAVIASLDLQGDVAWVQVLEGGPQVRRVRFYRQTNAGWKHTAPQPGFWRGETTTQYGRVSVHYHERDRPQIDPLLQHLSRSQHDVCQTIYCPTVSELDVVLTIDVPPYIHPYLDSDPRPQGSDTLYLSSPWVAGVPEDQPAQFAEETYWATYALASRAIKATTGQPLNPLQEAVLVEYAHWYVAQDTTLAPILGRILARNGVGALQEVFRTLREEDSLNAFVSFWLDISSGEQVDRYFETLLGIERDALVAGRLQTYLLLQDNRQPWWFEEQEQRFSQYQVSDTRLLPQVEVQAAQVTGDRASVTLAPTSVSPPYLTSVVYYRRRGQEWLHTSPLLGTR